MEILAICGSPRGKRSQTRRLAEKVLEAARTEGAQVSLEDLSTVRVEFCQACELCHKEPRCKHSDDGMRIINKILTADGLVLASPVYLRQVTAQLKTLLDRTSHIIHCLRMSGKYMAGVSTSGGGGGADVQTFFRQYANSVGSQFVGSVDARVPLAEKDFQDASALGSKLVAAIRNQESYPDQLQVIAEMRKRFGGLIASQKDRWPYEYQCWLEKGWLS